MGLLLILIMKFTKEVKEKWLTALKSGEYKQGFTELYTPKDDSFCCIGVLGYITEGLSHICNRNLAGDPYQFLKGNDISTDNIWLINDNDKNDPDYPRDYSNVIPLIERLETVN